MYDDLKNEVIYSENQSRLFEISIELTEKVSKLHFELVKNEDNLKKTEIKGQISVLNSMLKIIDKRIDSVKLIEADKERRELFINRQFRIAAETVLHRDTFNRIKELSLMNYKQFKDIKSDLKTNKLE